jgi:hypothetical protein
MLLRVFAVTAIIAITCLPLTGCTGNSAPADGGGEMSESDDGSSNTTTN